jgi:Zn-dependent peptidase ImmA (M78 family)
MLSERGALSRHNDSLFDGERNPFQPFSERHEVEANNLAAEILMPKEAISAAYDPIADNVAELAMRFGVSRRAMEIRLKILGLRRMP